MSYEINASFKLRLSDDVGEMAAQLAKATQRWRQFVAAIGEAEAEVDFAMREVGPKRGRPRGSNGAARRRRKAEPGAYAQEPLARPA